MNNLFRTISVICFCSVFILSCDKDKDGSDSCRNIVTVSRVTSDGSSAGVLYSIEYDEQGRVKTVKSKVEPPITYSYYQDSVLLSGKDMFGNDINRAYYLDANGRIKRTNYFDFQFTYDQEGYLVSFNEPAYDNGQISGFVPYTLTYQDGDLIEINTTAQVVGWQKINFKYYAEPNQDLLYFNQPLFLGLMVSDKYIFYLLSGGYLGKRPTHLYHEMAINGASGNKIMKYKKDKSGRIISNGNLNFDYKCP